MWSNYWVVYLTSFYSNIFNIITEEKKNHQMDIIIGWIWICVKRYIVMVNVCLRWIIIFYCKENWIEFYLLKCNHPKVIFILITTSLTVAKIESIILFHLKIKTNFPLFNYNIFIRTSQYKRQYNVRSKIKQK